MRTYILRRVLQVIPLLLGISLLSFILLKLAPGDFLNTMAENPQISPETLEAMRHRFGLDQPWYVQYGLYIKNIILPALVVGLIPLASRMRQMRGNLLDVVRLDYVTTARAKGLDENTVMFKHALRNALNPLITLFGFTLGSLVSGSLIAEIIFAWPGLGRITFDALLTQEQYLVLGALMIASLVLIL